MGKRHDEHVLIARWHGPDALLVLSCACLPRVRDVPRPSISGPPQHLDPDEISEAYRSHVEDVRILRSLERAVTGRTPPGTRQRSPH